MPAATPVLDIGGEIGALVVYLHDVPAGGELEACPVDRPEHRFHTGVHLRDIDGRSTPVAVFPEVHAGAYDILDSRYRSTATVVVTGGEVAELRLDVKWH
jgi:hypothetical protein